MARRVVDIDDPDRILAVLEDDEEAGCCIEVVRRKRRISVLLELEQLAYLADGVTRLVDELERRGLVAIEVGPVEMAPQARVRRHAFRAETLVIAWDDDGHRVVVEARAPDPDEGVGERASLSRPVTDDELDDVSDDDLIGPDVLRVRLRPYMAQRFARQARWLCGGRPDAASDVRPDRR
jgi:uncharacterized repeat protein (TIGR03847 family)